MKQCKFWAALLILLAALTAPATWATNVSYFDPNAAVGQQMKTANANALTGQGNLNSGWYYVSGNVTNNNRININGTVIIILTDGCRFTTSGGFHVTSGNELKIYAQSTNRNRGSLIVNRTSIEDLAIGGNHGPGHTGGEVGEKGENSGDVTICGGNITINGNIGGGRGGSGGSYQVNIGDDEWLNFGGFGGDGGDGGTFTFYGGNVTVTGFIGGGNGGSGQPGADANGSDGHTGGGGNINLSWSHPADRIKLNQCRGTVTLMKALSDVSNGHHITASEVAGKTLRPGEIFPSVSFGMLPVGLSVETDLITDESGYQYAIEGQVVTFTYDAPAGYIPDFKASYNYNYSRTELTLTDNGDGSYTFVMPNADVLIELPNLVPGPNDVMFYYPTAYPGDRQRIVLQPTALTDQTSLASGWYYVSGEVTIANRIAVNGTVNLILTDDCHLTASNGFHVASGNTLNIYAQSIGNNCGALTAGHSQNDAAIGGNGGADGDHSLNADQAMGSPAEEAGGNITIYGGNITTTGNIGGGDGGKGYSYTEYYGGGENYDYFGGIGGAGGSCGTVTIYGGIITVNGAIGGGNGGVGDSHYAQGEPGANGSGTVNLSWTTTSDRYYATKYNGTVTLTKEFSDSSNNNAVTASTIGGKTIKPICYLVSLSPELLAALPDEEKAEWEGIYASENEIVVFRYSAVPAGKIPQFSIKVDYGGGTVYYEDVYDNGDGTYHFYMSNVPVTIQGVMRSNIRRCTAKMPNQEPYVYSYLKHDTYPLSEALSHAGDVEYGFSFGQVVKDGDETLSLISDYSFGSVYNMDMTWAESLEVGGKYLIEINGEGDYYGTIYAPFTVISSYVSNQTWGNLTWSLSSHTLSITGTGDMMAAASSEDYPWYPFNEYIWGLSIGEGVTSIADKAFEGIDDQYENPYSGIYTTVTLPSTITSIGESAFAYCTSATVIVPAGTSVGNRAFLNVNKVGGNLGNNSTCNSGLIARLPEAQNVDVTLQGRTLYKDGDWNTLVLPFALASLTGTPLEDATLMELDPTGTYDTDKQTGYDAENGTLYLYFKPATEIVAGRPYIVKWTSGTDVTDPVFEGVTINETENPVAFTGGAFKGTYDKISYNADNRSILLVGTGNTLYYPQSGASIGACRAYFELSGGSQAPSRIVFSVDGESTATGMNEVGSQTDDVRVEKVLRDGILYIRRGGTIYDLQGRKVSTVKQ